MMDNIEERWTLEGAQGALEAYMREATQNGKHLGLSFAIADHDDLHFWNYGHRNRDRIEAVAEHHYFEIGSIGKVFTAILIACLIEEGACQADDPIRRYVPETGAFGDRVTVIQLLSHQAGLPRDPANLEFIAPKNSYKAYGDTQLFQALEMLTELEIKEQFSYSSFGYLILGVMARRITGHLRFADAVNESVLAPLNLRESKFELSSAEMTRLCHGHSAELEPIVPYLDLGELYSAAGGLKSTVADMIKLVKLMLNPELIPAGLRAPITQTMQLIANRDGSRTSFGWHVRTGTEPVCYFHAGSLAGTKSLILFSPALKRGIAYSSNTLSHVRPVWDLLLGPSA